MNSLTPRDKQLLHKEFNNGGYVLDFSNATFCDFCMTSIGIDIQEKYECSKGASLDCFFADGDDALVGKLISDLVQHRSDMALFGNNPIDSTEGTLLEECSSLADRLKSTTHHIQASILKKSSFGTPYIKQQVELMYRSIDEGNTAEAIGKAKELIESCAKTILKERGIDYANNDEYSTLVNNALKELKLKRESVPDDKKASATIKTILSSLTQTTLGIADLRNAYGTGHGRENDFSGLSQRHARLAVGSAATATIFLWDTHCAMNAAAEKQGGTYPSQ